MTLYRFKPHALAASSTQENALLGVSCTSTRFCMAAGIYIVVPFNVLTLTEEY